MKHELQITGILLLCSLNVTFGQSRKKNPDPGQTEMIGIPWQGDSGITETVEQIMAREAAHPFLFDPKSVQPTMNEVDEEHRHKKRNKISPRVSQWPAVDPAAAMRLIAPAVTTLTVSTGFDGMPLSTSGFVPPDSNGAAGPTQILVVANGRIRVYSKTGVLGPLDVSTNTFFSSVRNNSTTSDPHVRYDRLSGRWIVTMINVSTPNRVMIAVSSGSTITSQSSFTFFQFQQDQVGAIPNSDTGALADYDTFGVDANALYIGFNMFLNNSYNGTTAFVVRKSALLSGSLVVTAFRQLSTSSSAGIYTPQGVDNDDPSATEGYFVGSDNASFGLIVLRRVSNPGGTPTLSGNLNVTVPSTYLPLSQVASGSTQPLDALDDRLFAAMIKKNKITGGISLWTAHNIRVTSSGVGSSSGTRNAVRWYEIGNLTSTPSLVQSGTLFDNAASNPLGYWIGSVACNGQGHVFLGCSSAGSAGHAQISVSGRTSNETLGVTDAPVTAQTSSSSYNAQSTNPQRWGDYSQLTIDPTNDQDVWAFEEYCNASNSWMVHVTKLMAPPPATISSAVPSSVSAGQNSVSVVINGTSQNGTGFFEPGSAFTSHLAASVSGGVTVTQVTFNSPTQVTLTLNTVGASAGLDTVTITNPDGQSQKAAVLTVNNATAVTLNLKAYLQGFYLGAGTMNGAVSSTVSDTVKIKLANSTSPFAFVDSAVSTLSTNGTGTFTFQHAVSGSSYYIVFRHRNSLETWSAIPVTFSASSISYDFTTAAGKAFGSNMKNIAGAFCIYSGDVNQDGVIEAADYSEIENSVQLVLFGYHTDDVTGDDVVESADYSLIENNVQLVLFLARP